MSAKMVIAKYFNDLMHFENTMAIKFQDRKLQA